MLQLYGHHFFLETRKGSKLFISLLCECLLRVREIMMTIFLICFTTEAKGGSMVVFFL